MTPLEFLAEVLPSPGNGFYCAATLSEKKKEHIYVEHLEELEPAIARWHGAGLDCYFALATFDKQGKRTAENARKMKAFFIDMDGYETKRDAAMALDAFLVETGLHALGQPTIVGSGGGLHCYWPLEEAVDVASWKAVAEKLKRLCMQESLRIDMTVTADAARVLRVPETTNFKPKYPKPRPVRILEEGQRFEFDAIRDAIDAVLLPENLPMVGLSLPGQRPDRNNTAPIKLLENSTTSFAPIWLKTEAGTGCAQLKHYVDNAQEDGMEPLWRGILSWAKVCDDGAEYAVKISEMHPYSQERMLAKMREIKGPYTCATMDGENPGVCKTCPHYNKITTPLALGRVLQTETEEKQIRIVPNNAPTPTPPQEQDEEAQVLQISHPEVLTRPQAPRGFSYGRNGGVYCSKKEKDVDGDDVVREVQILPYDLFVVDMLRQEDDYVVHMVALRTDGASDILMPSRCVVSKDDTVKYLASQNIIASYGQGNDKNLFDYVRACVEAASLEKRAILVPKQCGWQADGSFVYNYRVFTPDGRQVKVPMPGLENINKNTASKGTLEGWREVWNMLIRRRMNLMLALCLDSFGCALMKFTQEDGFVWHFCSTKSGTGKTLALSIKAAVWGHHKQYRTSKNTSSVAMQQRAGLFNSLPMLIDETTSKARENPEWAPAFIFDITEGKGKDRMESGANRERVNDSAWKLTVTMTSNTNLTDYMSGSRKHGSNGELLRMLEWVPAEELEFSAEEKAILRTIDNNYGVAGEAWVKWLVRNSETAQRVMQETDDRLKVLFNFTDAERYWHIACTEIVAAAILLGGKHSGILETPVKDIVNALQDLIKTARGGRKETERTAEDVLTAFTRENYSKFITVRKKDGRIHSFFSTGDAVPTSVTRAHVLGRTEIDTLSAGYVEYFLEEQTIKQHCVSMSFGYADFKRQMEALHKVRYIKKDLLANTDGPTMRVNCMHITMPKEHALENTVPVGPSEEG